MGCSDRSGRRRQATGVQTAKTSCPKTPAAFRGDDQVLEAAAYLFQVRRALRQADQFISPAVGQFDQLRREEAQWSRYWHRSFRLSPASLSEL